MAKSEGPPHPAELMRAEKDLKLDPPDSVRRFKDLLLGWFVERSFWQAAFEGNPGNL